MYNSIKKNRRKNFLIKREGRVLKRKRFNSIQQFDISIRETDFQAKRGEEKSQVYFIYLSSTRKVIWISMPPSIFPAGGARFNFSRSRYRTRIYSTRPLSYQRKKHSRVIFSSAMTLFNSKLAYPQTLITA